MGEPLHAVGIMGALALRAWCLGSQLLRVRRSAASLGAGLLLVGGQGNTVVGEPTRSNGPGVRP
jgi:hypothetical protein